MAMLERDITGQKGLLNKWLPDGWFWFRLPDTGGRGFSHKPGFDGYLHYKNYAFSVEVKVDKIALTNKEKEAQKLFEDNGFLYVILCYYPALSTWRLITKYHDIAGILESVLYEFIQPENLEQ